MIEKLIKVSDKKKIMIALVGAGGKTTTMLYLAEYYKKLDMRVLVTTTTRIFVPEKSQYDNYILTESKKIMFENIKMGSITLLGQGLDENNKIIGLDINTLDKIYLESIFDVILVEADGSKHKPIKAPADHEPVIPLKSTHVIGVVGLDALGKIINDKNVHRLKEFVEITGTKLGAQINNSTILSLVNHKNGLFKMTPRDSKKILLLNKAVSADKKESGEAIKRELGWNKGISVVIRGRCND